MFLPQDAPRNFLSPSVEDEYLCVATRGETYGIPIMGIKEIIRPPVVTEVPRSPAFVKGLISLRGAIVPVLDTGRRLGLERSNATEKERLVVVKSRHSLTALLFERIMRVAHFSPAAVEAASTMELNEEKMECVSGVARLGNAVVMLLDLDRVTHIPVYAGSTTTPPALSGNGME